MKKKIVIATLVLLSGFAACSDDSGQTPPIVRATAVSLQGTIGLTSRAVIDSDYNKDLKVCFARTDILDIVDPTKTGPWGVHAAVRSGGSGQRPIIFTETQNYPPSGSLYLHGYYPANDGKKVVPDTGAAKVVFTIDGETDVMGTGRFMASSTQLTVPCTFYHLLTQLSFVCYSNQAGKWGRIVKIEATDIPLKQELDWTVETPVLTGVAAPDGSVEKGTLAVQDIAGPDIPQVNEGAVLPEAKGYILLPVAGGFGTLSDPLWLTVTTSKDGKGADTETDFRIAIYVEGGFRTGERHIITLRFTDGIGIEVARVEVAPWKSDDQGELPL